MKTFKIYTPNTFDRFIGEGKWASQFMRWDVKHCYYGDPHPPPSPHEKIFYLDGETYHAQNHQVREKIAIPVETRHIFDPPYDFVRENINLFDRVLTYDEDLINQFPETCLYTPVSFSCSFPKEECHIYEKSKDISYISSDKKLIPGHWLRHVIYERVRETIDCYGSITGVRLENKLDSLKDYRYQIVAENNPYYSSEKIIDSFVTGTIPIYWGSRGITRQFDESGILFFESVDELISLLPQCTTERFESMSDVIEENYQRALQFCSVEDWLYENTDVFESEI